MIKFLSGIAAITLVASSATIASAQMATARPSPGMTAMPRGTAGASGMMMSGAHGHMPNMNCTSAANFVVWLVPSTKTYYRKGQARFGKGAGRYVCRRQAVANGAKLGASAAGSTSGSMPAGASLPPVQTMAPRPTRSAMPMPMSSAMPHSSMNPVPMASPRASATPRA